MCSCMGSVRFQRLPPARGGTALGDSSEYFDGRDLMAVEAEGYAG